MVRANDLLSSTCNNLINVINENDLCYATALSDVIKERGQNDWIQDRAEIINNFGIISCLKTEFIQYHMEWGRCLNSNCNYSHTHFSFCVTRTHTHTQ